MTVELICILSQLLSHFQASVQVMAKSLIRNRHAVTKMYGLKSQLQSVSLRLAVSMQTRLVKLCDVVSHAFRAI